MRGEEPVLGVITVAEFKETEIRDAGRGLRAL
jgi:hypothetical protein